MYRCSILMEKTLPSPFLLSLLFLIGCVCRKFLTYIGQGNLHVFLEIFLALDLTAILALQADGWISFPSPFHKTQRHAQEFETLGCFSVPLYLLPFSPSKLSSGALLAGRGHRLPSPFCTATGTKKQVQVPWMQAE